MNIVYMHTHDSGRCMQPYGIAAENPNLMRLAREGFLFHQAFSTAPTCSCSRTGLLTGMAPHSTGMFGLAHRGFQSNDFSKHLSHFLHRNGYYTVLSGVQHEAKDVASLGYDEHFARKDQNSRTRDMYSLEYALDFLHSGRNGEKPFFLSFGMYSTHLIYEENKDIEEEFVLPPFPIVNTKETRHDFANYLQSLKTADDCVGAILDALDKTGHAQDTIVLYTTDHGISFPEMKSTLKDVGIGVALLLRHPLLGHGESDALVSHLDIYPTLCDMLHLEKPDWLEGRSLLPLMMKKEEKVHEYIFSEMTYHAAYEPMRAVRTERLNYIRIYEPLKKPLVNIGDHEAKDIFLTSKLPYIPRAHEYLYDLIADPAERINLAAVPEYQEELAHLSGVLDQWMADTHDPLLDGPILMQPGQVANRIDAVSPYEPVYDYEGNPVASLQDKK